MAQTLTINMDATDYQAGVAIAAEVFQRLYSIRDLTIDFTLSRVGEMTITGGSFKFSAKVHVPATQDEWIELNCPQSLALADPERSTRYIVDEIIKLVKRFIDQRSAQTQELQRSLENSALIAHRRASDQAGVTSIA